MTTLILKTSFTDLKFRKQTAFGIDFQHTRDFSRHASKSSFMTVLPNIVENFFKGKNTSSNDEMNSFNGRITANGYKIGIFKNIYMYT